MENEKKKLTAGMIFLINEFPTSFEYNDFAGFGSVILSCELF